MDLESNKDAQVIIEELIFKNVKLKKELTAARDVIAAARSAETSMDTAAACGVKKILSPAYEDSWCMFHEELIKALDHYDKTRSGDGS